jgi:hypothetical protein
MTTHDFNVREAEQMLNRIAERSGGDRASVFLDIIIALVFSKDMHTFRNSEDPNVRRSQQVLDEIAAVYQIQAPRLKNGRDEADDPNEIPF